MTSAGFALCPALGLSTGLTGKNDGVFCGIFLCFYPWLYHTRGHLFTMSHPKNLFDRSSPATFDLSLAGSATEQNQGPSKAGYCSQPRQDYILPMHQNLPSSTKPLDQSSLSKTTLTFQRSRDRLNIACPVMFAGVPFIGEGAMHNLSRTGCRVECDRAVLQGSYMTLRLLLPDGIRSLIVELAAVRWVRERYFGIEFLRLPASEQARIEQFLTRHHR